MCELQLALEYTRFFKTMCPKCISDFVPKLIGTKCFGDRQKKEKDIDCFQFSTVLKKKDTALMI